MTKADIVNYVHEKAKLPKRDSVEVVEAILEALKAELLGRNNVKISGFGNFVVRRKKARMGRNIRGNCPIPIGERWTITFKPSQILKGKMNGRPVGAGRKAAAVSAAALSAKIVQVSEEKP